MPEPTPPSEKPIGDVGEDFVEQLCTLPLGKDFLFRGQMYRTKDGDVELCDLLLLLDDTAVLMEVKTALRDKKEGWTDEQWSEWANKRMEKALSQMERGCNALLTGQVKQVENERQGVVAVDPARLKHVYGVIVVDHPTLDKWGKGPSFSVNGRTISILTTTHEELQHLLVELSTPGDFADYMQAREAFFAKNMMMGISELDLLAFYKGDPDEFNRHVAEKDLVIIGEGCWDEFAKLDARKQRTELDKYSYAVDAMLDILYEGRRAKLPHIEERRAKMGQDAGAGDKYVVIATELARIRRMDRRVIGNKLLEKSRKCVEQKRDRWFASAPERRQGPAFVFLVSTNDREKRMRSLEVATWGGKLSMNARRIIGIATEPITGGHGFSVDAFMIDQNQADDRKMIPSDVQKELEAQFGAPRRADDTEFGGVPGASSGNPSEG
jgi:hypothetical protein